MSHFYTSIAFALAQNTIFLESASIEFRDLLRKIKKGGYKPGTARDHDRIVRHAIKKASRMVHHSTRKYNIVPSMREEIDFFEQQLKPNSGIKWEAPIAFLIKRMPFASTFGDACLEAGGGYSIKLKFWWHIKFPEEVVRRTLKHMPNNKDERLISINVLEFIVVIIDYCAALVVVMTENVTDDPFPILLNAVDNTSAHSWTTHTCKSS